MYSNGGGLIAAPTDQSSGGEWECKGTTISGADGTAIGTGNQNTLDIKAGCTTAGTAADICANLTLGGYSDWFLPSKDELNEMYLMAMTPPYLGSFAGNFYLTSSQTDSTNCWIQYFVNGNQVINGKTSNLHVRAIRAFQF